MLKKHKVQIEMQSSKQPQRLARLFREGAIVVVGQLLTVLGALVGVRLLTTQLNPAEYGELALGLTAATLFTQVITGPLAGGALRFYAPAHEKSEKGDYLLAVGRLVLRSTIMIVMIIGSVATLLIINLNQALLPLIVSAGIYSIFSGGNALLNGVQTAARHRVTVSLHQALDSWARPLTAVALLAFLGSRSEVAVAGYCVASGLVLASQYLLYRKTIYAEPKNRSTPVWQKAIVSYSWPFCVWGVFGWLQQASDRWALAVFAGKEDVGHYTVLFQLGYYPVMIATGVAVQFLAPILFQKAGDASDSTRNAHVNYLSGKLAMLALVGTAACSLGAILLHKEIFALFVASNFGNVSGMLPFMVLAGGLFAAAQILALDLMSRFKSKSMLFTKVGSALLGTGANIVGAYYAGVQGVVMAAVCFSFTYLLGVSVLWAKNEQKI